MEQREPRIKKVVGGWVDLALTGKSNDILRQIRGEPSKKGPRGLA